MNCVTFGGGGHCDAASALVSAEIKMSIPTFTGHELSADLNRDGTFVLLGSNTAAYSCDSEGE
jgi:hypothetical protein